VECPFHGKSPEEEEERRGMEDIESPEEEFEVRGLKSGQDPARDRTGPRPLPFRGKAELVPVAVRASGVDPLKAAEFQEEAFPDVGIPVLPPAVGVPLYIPDENIPEGLFPPGFGVDAAAEIGVAAEEAFAEMISGGRVSTAMQTSILLGSQEVFEGGNPAFTELGWLFAALFAGNAVAHLWQTYNARLSGVSPRLGRSVSRLSPVQTSVRAPKIPPQKVNPPKAVPVPKAAPPRIPVRASGGGGIGFYFQSNPGSVEPPLPQAEFNRVFQRTLEFAPVVGGGQAID